jgi:hypothetical protein
VSARWPWRIAALASAATLFVLAPRRAPPPSGETAAERGLAQRLLGPIASLAASAQWVRVDLAFRAGHVELALARAEQALALDPGSPELWQGLAWVQAYTLASPEREPDPALRLAWLASGLATAAEGEARSRDPAELAVVQGMILMKVAWYDPELPWPGGARALWTEAERHFARAQDLGHGMAEELRRAARHEADQSR